jgi:D-amino peptidase
MRIFISADIEGVAGVAHLPSTGPNRFEFDLGRKWYTEEVLAAIEGAEAAGATEFVVADGHGTAHMLLLDRFNENVRIVRSWPRPLLQMQGIEHGTFGAAVFVGHHGSAQARLAVLAHTFTGAFRDIRVNGVSQSETTLNALVAGHFGVPLVFSSGDHDYIAHVRETLPDVETIITKEAVGKTSVNTLTPKASCALIKAGVEKALREKRAKAMPQPASLLLTLEFQERSQPEMLGYLPWLESIDAYTVEARFQDAVTLMKFISFVSFYIPSGLPRYGETP